MDNERTADVLQVALASYDRKELRVQKNYLEEQNPVLACTCFLNGHKLLQELQQGHNFDIVVLCSQMEDMSSIEFMMELRKLEHKPLLMLFDEGRRKNSSALRMEDSGSCCCVERMELKNLLRELYRMPGQQWQRTEQQCQQLYHSWGIRIPDINCSYLTSAVGVVYGTSQKLAIRKEILQAVSEQYGVSVSAVDSGIRRMIDQLEAKPAEGWTQFKAESGFEAETTGLWALKRILAPRKLNTNKGSFGYLLSLCGSRGMAGAAVMSAQAASRCGVGLIDLALPESVYPAAASAIRESVFTLLPEQENEISISEAEALLSGKLAHRTTACLVGCGLGTSREAQKLVEYLLAHSKAPMVIDADGLNAIAAEPEMLSKAQAPLVLTPHPGEMARLLKTTVQDVQRHRLEYAKEFAVKQRLVLVLKGNKTVVACPDGRVYINTTGNPGMAKAGSGDVLAGIIGAFLAQGMAPEQAAAGGVYLHGLAGDRCAERLSQIGMTAPDLIEELPALFLELTATK